METVRDASRKNIRARLKRTRLGEFSNTTVLRNRTSRTRPEPDSIVSALDDFRVDPTKTTMMGDSWREEHRAR
ncbi:hypothetical protein AKJ63_01755 [candidate division MSBL1 archaeon SCGC-AAA259D18]|uniref:Uncharacterized protein n=1 Tax=candidate division MSBL1 archaeon SCGC-AAA259D18 TaxID=1698262 RepID=A0A133UAP3_9EURY|nr:hypothetical protein AKJ63_01755 [candidate division MSBL1 archaeon SCGC-AAA259D18]